MTEPLTVARLTELLRPVFAELLEPDELASLEVRLVLTDFGIDAPALAQDVRLDEVEAWVRWRILGEVGVSNGLSVEEGEDVLVRRVRGDLQDFISETTFGWGQLRGPLDPV